MGTETSQYRQERKETSTPSVAASERGLAQTAGAFTTRAVWVPAGLWGDPAGVRTGRELQRPRLAEVFRKAPP